MNQTTGAWYSCDAKKIGPGTTVYKGSSDPGEKPPTESPKPPKKPPFKPPKDALNPKEDSDFTVLGQAWIRCGTWETQEGSVCYGQAQKMAVETDRAKTYIKVWSCGDFHPRVVVEQGLKVLFPGLVKALIRYYPTEKAKAKGEFHGFVLQTSDGREFHLRRNLEISTKEVFPR